jgi:biopolymer transport protein ExbD
MITRPLDLQSHLKPPSSRLNPLPLLDVLFIALFFSILGSNFVLSPGLTINLPQAEGSRMAGLSASVVLTVHSDSMLFFQERILNMDTLKPALTEHVERRGETNLVILFDREVSVQTLVSVTELAREAGVARVQVATELGQSGPPSGPVFR